VVIDALDEAANPQVLVRDVLARLEPDPAAPRIRLLIGVRSQTGADRTDIRSDLSGSAMRLPGGRAIRVDEHPGGTRRISSPTSTACCSTRPARLTGRVRSTLLGR
jgi:hypothetical protein